MLGKSAQTIRRLIDDLLKQGWIQARRNPKYKWDQTYQYRANLHIQSDLFLAGYPFDGYKYSISPTSKMEIRTEEKRTSQPNSTATQLPYQ